MRTASEIILFGSRLLLAHNHELFPCQTGLLQAVRRIRRKPRGYWSALIEFAEHPCPESKEAFCRKIDGYTDWTGGRRESSRVLTRFVEDNEWWWWKERPFLAEW
ncbi:MAG: hypothetical protein BWZ10_01864 [candidate division BRC1 bacterium ADurb.BinA364]|nr:MAG: hypothetical protein BWZ10_01864 [candidate division BRC1 bacterium ADurb.BinA364]